MFGQVVIGPPGSGKTTYCSAFCQLLHELKRPVCLVNLDPANDLGPVDCDDAVEFVDVRELVTLADVMDYTDLGPNGGLVHCLDYVESRFDWLRDRLEQRRRTDAYVMFDMPGQVELYTHQGAVRRLLKRLEEWGYRLVTVNVADGALCLGEANKFASAACLALMSMVQLETPHLNVLTKMDLVDVDVDEDNMLNLSCLADILDADPFTKKHAQLNRAISKIVDDYGLVSFIPLNIQVFHFSPRIRTYM